MLTDISVESDSLSYCTHYCVNRQLSYICWFQKLPKSLAEACGIEAHGRGLLAGLRLGPMGGITICAYKVDPSDGRIILGAEGRWKNFLHGKNLMVGQVIIISIRDPVQANLRVMVVIDII